MASNEKIKIGVGFITGRKNFINVLKANYKDWKKTGIIDNPNIELNIFVAYDLSFSGVNEHEFKKIPKEIVNHVNEIVFIGETQIKELNANLKEQSEISEQDSSIIFGTHGYSKLRNSVLYHAIQKNMDYLLYIDDDEYPYAVIRDADGSLKWEYQSTLQVHLESIVNCDVTYGYKCGYVSPIPYFELGKEIEEDVLKNYIEVMSNDAFNWAELKDLMCNNKGITYAEENIIKENYIYEVKSEDGGKWVWGTNVCLNLKRMGKTVPLFYNPPEARGEDTFFSTLLKSKKVLRVPVYNFHDSFLRYTKEMVKEDFPTGLIEMSYKNSTDDRFLKASIGWVRYKPLLLYIKDKKLYREKMKEIYEKIDSSLPEICESLQRDEFYKVKDELRKYDENVEEHYKEFKNVYEVWKTILNTPTDEAIEERILDTDFVETDEVINESHRDVLSGTV